MKAGYTRNINPIASVYYFNPIMGVYRAHEENVKGGDDYEIKLVFDKGLGDSFHSVTNINTSASSTASYISQA